MYNGVIRYQLCTLHTYISDLNNLKNEGRRSIGKQYSNVDVINVLSTCYELEEVKLRNHFEEDDEYFVCAKCFNTFKAIFACQSKCKQLIDSLRASTSSSFQNFTNVKFVPSATDTYTEKHIDIETESYETSIFSTTKKRCRNILTPSKLGCTPRAKRTARTPKAKNNRRRVDFSQTPQVGTQSPGPQVKVKAIYKILQIHVQSIIFNHFHKCDCEQSILFPPHPHPPQECIDHFLKYGKIQHGNKGSH